MVRRTSWIGIGALLAALPALAGTTGFSLTHEETNLTFPPLNTFIAPPGYAAEIGTVNIFADNVAKLEKDPINSGAAPCDATSSKALIIDGTSLVAEVHLEFPMIARGNLTVFDRVQTGAENNTVDGLGFGVYSGITHRPEVDFEYRADGYVYALGQKIDTGGGNYLRYDNVWASDCSKGIDNHFTVDLFHNLVGGTVVVEVTTHGATSNTYRTNPMPMLAEVKREGIRGMYVFVPPNSGRYSVDGMVCTGNAPIILPTGGDDGGAGRKRF